MTKTALERFVEKYEVVGDCWIWRACIAYNGYGLFSLGRRLMGAHRASYILHKGEIPMGLQLDHLCRNRKCVNPFHLEAVSAKENLMRGNGSAAKNHRKTHCKRGHIFDKENTKMEVNGSRQCRICRRERQKSSRAMKRV